MNNQRPNSMDIQNSLEFRPGRFAPQIRTPKQVEGILHIFNTIDSNGISDITSKYER